MRGKTITACIVLVCIVGCSSVPPMVSTPSGRPEKTYAGFDVARVQSVLAAICLEKRAVIESNAPGQLVCSRATEGWDAVLGSMIVGGKYGSQPVIKVRFTLFDYGGGTRVQAYQWLESTNAFGRVDQRELNSGEQFNSVQLSLEGAHANLNTAP